MASRVRGVYGTPWSKLANNLKVSPEILSQLGDCLIKVIAAEAKKDFAKRGWSGKDPMGGPVIWKSFSHRISGKSTLEILSTFYGLDEMTSGNIPSRRMEWLTQQSKKQNPSAFKRTQGERRRKGSGRLPLVIPIKGDGGTVIFRTAPLKTADAWIHPGIAKFTFMQRAVKKGRRLCADIIGQDILDQLSKGDPTR